MSESNSQSHESWTLRQPYGWKTIAVLAILVIGLSISAKRTEIDRGAQMTAEGVMYTLGLKEESELAVGWKRFFGAAFPITLEQKTAVSRLENFDRDRLPMFAYLVKEPIREYDIEKGKLVVTGEEEFLIEPLGYVWLVTGKMIETIEMAMWGTLLAVVLAIPLAYLSARGYSWNRLTYTSARAVCSFCRALPELIIAIFFVLLFGFGPLPGVIALGVHCCGFLGKFFADDIENVDQGPQDALRITGASRLQVLWYAVLPQTTPQFVAYIQYIAERNVRSATVLGIVGAGGIGLELKGRLDLSDYSHVATILLVVFVTVFLLEAATQRLRGKIISA